MESMEVRGESAPIPEGTTPTTELVDAGPQPAESREQQVKAAPSAPSPLPFAIAKPLKAGEMSGALGKVHLRTPEEDLAFAECEATISSGWSWFVKVGLAFAKIKKEALYKNEFDSFDLYYRTRWGYRHSHVYGLMASAAMFQELAKTPNIPMPDHESLVRPLVGMEPELARYVWQSIATASGGATITARMVRRAVRMMKPTTDSPGQITAVRQQRYDRRRAIRDGFNEVLNLLVRRADYEAVIEKVQFVQRHVDQYFGDKTRSVRFCLCK